MTLLFWSGIILILIKWIACEGTLSAIEIIPQAKINCEDNSEFVDECPKYKAKGLCKTRRRTMESMCALTCQYCGTPPTKKLKDLINDAKAIKEATGSAVVDIKDGSPSAQGKFQGNGADDAEKEATETPQEYIKKEQEEGNRIVAKSIETRLSPPEEKKKVKHPPKKLHKPHGDKIKPGRIPATAQSPKPESEDLPKIQPGKQPNKEPTPQENPNKEKEEEKPSSTLSNQPKKSDAKAIPIDKKAENKIDNQKPPQTSPSNAKLNTPKPKTASTQTELQGQGQSTVKLGQSAKASQPETLPPKQPKPQNTKQDGQAKPKPLISPSKPGNPSPDEPTENSPQTTEKDSQKPASTGTDEPEAITKQNSSKVSAAEPTSNPSASNTDRQTELNQKPTNDTSKKPDASSPAPDTTIQGAPGKPNSPTEKPNAPTRSPAADTATQGAPEKPTNPAEKPDASTTNPAADTATQGAPEKPANPAEKPDTSTTNPATDTASQGVPEKPTNSSEKPNVTTASPASSTANQGESGKPSPDEKPDATPTSSSPNTTTTSPSPDAINQGTAEKINSVDKPDASTASPAADATNQDGVGKPNSGEKPDAPTTSPTPDTTKQGAAGKPNSKPNPNEKPDAAASNAPPKPSLSPDATAKPAPEEKPNPPSPPPSLLPSSGEPNPKKPSNKTENGADNLPQGNESKHAPKLSSPQPPGKPIDDSDVGKAKPIEKIEPPEKQAEKPAKDGPTKPDQSVTPPQGTNDTPSANPAKPEAEVNNEPPEVDPKNPPPTTKPPKEKPTLAPENNPIEGKANTEPTPTPTMKPGDHNPNQPTPPTGKQDTDNANNPVPGSNSPTPSMKPGENKPTKKPVAPVNTPMPNKIETPSPQAKAKTEPTPKPSLTPTAIQPPIKNQPNTSLAIVEEAEMKSSRAEIEVGDTSGCDNACQRECLTVHNKYRENHNALPLKWDKALSEQAQILADRCAETGKPAHSDWLNGKGGESIAMGKHKPSFTVAIKDWHDEEDSYDFETGKSRDGKAVGHFTQLVWKDAELVGCAKSIINGQPFYVVQYDKLGMVADAPGHQKDEVIKGKQGDLDWFNDKRSIQMREKGYKKVIIAHKKSKLPKYYKKKTLQKRTHKRTKVHGHKHSLKKTPS